jgi:hypothetical protein
VLDQLGTTERFAVEENYSDVQMGLLSPDGAKTFYHLVDRRRRIGFEWSDGWTVASAQEALATGKAYDAVTELGQELIRCHQSGCWRASRQASSRYAKACLQSGLIDGAF